MCNKNETMKITNPRKEERKKEIVNFIKKNFIKTLNYSF